LGRFNDARAILVSLGRCGISATLLEYRNENGIARKGGVSHPLLAWRMTSTRCWRSSATASDVLVASGMPAGCGITHRSLVNARADMLSRQWFDK